MAEPARQGTGRCWRVGGTALSGQGGGGRRDGGAACRRWQCRRTAAGQLVGRGGRPVVATAGGRRWLARTVPPVRRRWPSRLGGYGGAGGSAVRPRAAR